MIREIHVALRLQKRTNLSETAATAHQSQQSGASLSCCLETRCCSCCNRLITTNYIPPTINTLWQCSQTNVGGDSLPPLAQRRPLLLYKQARLPDRACHSSCVSDSPLHSSSCCLSRHAASSSHTSTSGCELPDTLLPPQPGGHQKQSQDAIPVWRHI